MSNAFTNSSARAVLDTDLTADLEAEARRIYDALEATTDAVLMDLTRLLPTKADTDLLGATEFTVRNAIHRIDARALETALPGGKRGTTAPAVPAPVPGQDRPERSGTGATLPPPTTMAHTAAPATAPGTRHCA